MARTSAGLLPFHRDDAGGLHVFVAHMGGPFWLRRDRSWTIVKGEYAEGDESPLAAAEREFAEEIGVPAPPGPRIDLGEIRQSGGKRVRAFGVETDRGLVLVASNTVELEWPPRSGRTVSFPEVDRAEWWDLASARDIVVAGQVALLDRLVAIAAETPTG